MIDLKELDNDPWSTFPAKKDDLRALMSAVTLRDQFAMAALTGINVKEFKPYEIAWMAYELADAMMEARK
jgi:hypothetical protein